MQQKYKISYIILKIKLLITKSIILRGVKNMISNRIKRLRKERNISQEQLAEVVGVSKTTISYYENGLRVPDADLVIKLVKYFNVSADFLLGLTDDKYCAEDEDDQEVSFYATTALSNTKNREELKRFLNTFSGAIQLISQNSSNELLLLKSLSKVVKSFNNITAFYDMRLEYIEMLINGLVEKGVSKHIVAATAIAYIERDVNEFEEIVASLANNFNNTRKNIEQVLKDKFKEMYKVYYKEEISEEDYITYKYFISDNNKRSNSDNNEKSQMKLINLDDVLNNNKS